MATVTHRIGTAATAVGLKGMTMPIPTDILDEGILPEGEYLGPWIPTHGLALVVLTSGDFENPLVQFTIQESLDGEAVHYEAGPFNNPWWEDLPPPGGWRCTWVPAMRYMRLRIVSAVGGGATPFSLRGIRY